MTPPTMLAGFSSEWHLTIGLYQRREVLQALAVAALPWGPIACTAQKKGPLQVGGLPVTCNLTLPVACVGQGREQSHGSPRAAAI